MKGLMQFAQADSTQTQKIVTAMLKFVTLAHSMLQSGQGLNDGGWGAARWQDFALVVEWYVLRLSENLYLDAKDPQAL
jgi:hypothetical protein